MIKAKSLYHLILYSIFFIIILTSSFTFIIIENAFDEFQEKIKIIKTDYENKQKDLIEADVKKSLKFINYYYNKFKDIKSENEIKNDILEALEKMRENEKLNNYLFIYDFDGTSIYYPISKEYIGKNLYEFKDPSGKKVIKELIDISKKKDGGFVQYIWYKPEIKDDALKISYAHAYEPLNWTVGRGIYLDEINKIVQIKKDEYDEKISNYILQIVSLTVMLVLYSIFIYKNATILIVNDVKEIGKYFKESQKDDLRIKQDRLIFGEFKVIANYAYDAMHNIKDKNTMLRDINKHLEETVNHQTKELQNLIDSQKKFLKNSVHEINTPLSIIRTNIDLLKMNTLKEENKYISNIESGAKIIQYIYDDLSYLIKKDRVDYPKEYIDFSLYLKERLNFFEGIATSNDLHFTTNIDEDIYIKFNRIELQRIIDNNISNSIKYSYAKSAIYVRLTYFKNDFIEFSVKTNSEKIENINKIFDDFYRENNSRGGFGLGLRIVKEICDKNLVIIKLESTDTETKFTYRFRINENTTS
ncbi:cache domain-containing protein [Halarcobacter ebronensis]|uniref:histidine kinase n=1 Tax=Halarcobacter ebronensis TaxID=1462615 RepID=A0A4Q1AHL6_9BACT|nr:cache domain-containing protein [Halarcobacter ebronensis]QKF81202.1 Cache sensor-containing two-component system histidine kinase [Halarcobacter ebronensis]RXK03223.1 histidine kinase [Halarcobacter ebronensis]